MTLYEELEDKVISGETTWHEVYDFIQSLLAMRKENDYMYEKEEVYESHM